METISNSKKNAEPNKDKQSNLEFFRIVLAFLIIIHHFIVHGVGYQSNAFTTNNIIAVALEPVGRMAVICFALLSGYFLCDFTFKLEKFTKLILEMVFYTLIWFTVLTLTKQVPYSVDFLKYSVLPFLYGNWFLTCYLLIYLVSPLIKKVIIASTERELRFYTIGFYLLTSFICFLARNTLIEEWFTRPILFMFWLFAGAWLRKGNYSINWKWRLIGITAFSIGACIRLALLYSNSANADQHDIDKYSSYFSPFLIMVALVLFLEFKGLRIKNNKIINGASMTVLGIYLIHDNDYARITIWHTLLKTENYVNSPYFILYMFGCSALVFSICFIADLIRKNIFEKSFFFLLYRTIN